MKARLMMCLMAFSVVLAGYISCLIASHIHWHYGWISAPALLPGLTFGLDIAQRQPQNALMGDPVGVQLDPA